MFKLQYFRTSAPSELLVADPDESGAAPFAYTGTPSSPPNIYPGCP